MKKNRLLKDIPESEVDQIAADYESEGAHVERAKQDNGLWSILAKFAKNPAASKRIKVD